MNNALVVEPYTPATYAFIDGLHEATHCRVRHSETLEDGLRTMEQTYCDVLIVTITSQLQSATRIVERIRSRAVDLLIRPPDIVLLFKDSFPVPEVQKCRELDAMCFRRELLHAVYDEARLAFWKRATRKYEVTFRIDYRHGHHFLFVGPPAAQIVLGPQLTRLAVLLLNGNESYTVEYLADELSICRQSVKKYFSELRRAFEGAFARSDIGGRIAEIFFMEKRVGGTVCGVKANVIWN